MNQINNRLIHMEEDKEMRVVIIKRVKRAFTAKGGIR
jgi:hypothetical protein